jgi:AraC-like DNA-binding protein
MTTSLRAHADRQVDTSPSYEEHAPPRDLGDVVACTWVASAGERASQPEPIIADACSDIIVVGDAEPHVAGPATRTHFVQTAPGSVIVGIRFRPGAARAVFDCSATELVDGDPYLREVCGRTAYQLENALRSAPTTDSKRDALANWVRARIERRRTRDEQLLRAAHSLVADHRQSVSALSDALGWSARRLHREFSATCGYSPKYLQRILRLQRALRRAHTASNRPMSLSWLAADTGYADQAHMTRDFRDITGFTPRELLSHTRLDVGRWLDDGR